MFYVRAPVLRILMEVYFYPFLVGKRSSEPKITKANKRPKQATGNGIFTLESLRKQKFFFVCV